jgi:hypothetical protein
MIMYEDGEVVPGSWKVKRNGTTTVKMGDSNK